MINAGRSDDSGLKPLILYECAINGDLHTKKVKGNKKNGKKDVFSPVATDFYFVTTATLEQDIRCYSTDLFYLPH